MMDGAAELSGLQQKLNRRDTAPSASMLPSDGNRYRCPWIEGSLTILADGNVTCGLDDPHSLRSFGNVNDQSLTEIFANPEFTRLQQGLAQGRRCAECQLYQPMPEDRPSPRPALPRALIVESTIRCNLRCPNAACIPNNAAEIRTRDSEDLDRGALQRLVAEAAPALEEVYFFNYGDPFLHREAVEMVADIRAACPDVRIVTSTNGIPLAGQRAEKLVAAGLDNIVFTISGMRQESYEKYHVRGRLATALKGLRRVAEARRAAGAARPEIVWRYLVHRWTDDPDEITEAIALAEELGIDELSFYITHIPEGAHSYRMAPGTPQYHRFETRLAVAHGYNVPALPPNGLFPLEVMPHFGPCRWTGWRAVTWAAAEGDTVRVWLATNQPSVENGTRLVRLRLPWGAVVETELPYCEWGELRIPRPTSRRGRTVERVEILVPEPWFPIDETGSEDTRCLGVLTTTTASPRSPLPRIALPCTPASLPARYAFRKAFRHALLTETPEAAASGEFLRWKPDQIAEE